MLKKSLLTVAILGVFAAAAGAHSEGEVEKTKDVQTPGVEFTFEAPPATCGADVSDAQSKAWFESLVEQQTSSSLEEAEVEVAYRRGGRRCILCMGSICYPVAC